MLSTLHVLDKMASFTFDFYDPSTRIPFTTEGKYPTPARLTLTKSHSKTEHFVLIY